MATYKFVDSGAGGGNDGTSWADAWTSIVSANGVAADTIVLVKGGTTYDAQDGATNSCLNASANGTISQPIIYQGDDASGGAGEGVAATFTLDAGTNTLAFAAIPAQWTVWKYVIFTGGSTGGLYLTAIDNVLCYKCLFHDTATGAAGDNYWVLINCEIYNNTFGVNFDLYAGIIGCEFYNNSVSDITNVDSASLILFNIFHEDNDITCFTSSNAVPSWIIGNTFDGMNDGIGINFTSAAIGSWPVILNNCIYDLATGIQTTTDCAGGFTAIRNNLFNSNMANVNANDNIRVGEDTQTGAPAFVTEGSDYHPASGSPLIDNALDAGSL